MTKRVTNAELSVTLEHIKEKVDATHECVYGNGNPKEGMATRLIQVEDFQRALKRVLWIAATALIISGIALIT